MFLPGCDTVQFGTWTQLFQKEPVSSFVISNIPTRRHVSQDTVTSRTFDLKSLYIKPTNVTFFFVFSLETFAF